MEVRYVNSEKQDTNDLISKVNSFLTELEYKSVAKTPIITSGYFLSKLIFHEQIYENENNGIIVAHYAPKRSMPMLDCENREIGYSDCRLLLFNMGESEIKRLEQKIPLINPDKIKY